MAFLRALSAQTVKGTSGTSLSAINIYMSVYNCPLPVKIALYYKNIKIMFLISETILQFADFANFILIKLVTSLFYLVINYVTHKIALPVTLANLLRLIISVFDFAILLVLLFCFVWELCEMAIAFSILGILFTIIMCATSWLVLVRQQEVRSVFIIGVFSLIVLLILHLQFFFMDLMYKGPMAALFIFNITYIACWLVFDAYPKGITSFMERVGEGLYWVDPLIGETPPNALALRNVCSFNLGLLNLTYIHTSGEAVNVITVILICLGLLANVLVGLRLIKKSTSVKLYDGFMVQIIINGYNNIIIIYDQLKNKQLPKARWYAWAIALIMGLNFISPSYCMATSERPQIDASLTGEGQPSAGGQGPHSPVAEGARGSRLGQGPAYAYARDVSAGVVATGVATGIQQAATTIMDQPPGTEETGPSPLEAANERAQRAEGASCGIRGRISSI